MAVAHNAPAALTRAGAPLCGDARFEAPLRRVLDRCTEFLLSRLPRGKMVALVLTGSFARGEGSVMRAGGELRVLGDIEFMVVLPSEVDFHTLRAPMQEWSREASRAVRDEVRVDIEFGPVEVGYLRQRARPSIFVYDLHRHGRVVWGPPDLLEQIPRFEAADIPRVDAVHLVFNRLIEQLDAYERATSLGVEALWDLAYQRLKLTLDLAGSALAFSGRHEPSYAARPAAFVRLCADTPALAEALPPAFAGELERAARLKLVPGSGHEVVPPDLSIEARRSWVRDRITGAVPAVAEVLQWELGQLYAVDEEMPRLLQRWMAAPGYGRRLWDWTKVALNPLPSPVPLAPLRAARLFFRSTPRGVLYAAGALAYLNLVRPTARPSAIRRLLFARGAPLRRDPGIQRRTVTALWRWCVRNA